MRQLIQDRSMTTSRQHRKASFGLHLASAAKLAMVLRDAIYSDKIAAPMRDCEDAAHEEEAGDWVGDCDDDGEDAAHEEEAGDWVGDTPTPSPVTLEVEAAPGVVDSTS